MSIHDLDIAMVTVSTRLAQYLMVYMLIGNIRVYMTKNGYETIKNERHNSVTPELLARKGGRGL